MGNLKPRSLSASSLNVASKCMARYKAEHIDRAANFKGSAANLGIALHGALESFILGTRIKKNLGWGLEELKDCWDQSFKQTIGPDVSSAEYKEGWKILIDWFNRPSTFDELIGTKIVSVESKNSFDIPVEIDGVKGTVPFNYIMDRVDRISPTEYRVVDYKSNRVSLDPEDLWSNIQARAYALAIAIKFKGAEKIWVQFDFLRHGTIGVLFTREDNIATWKMLKSAAQAIFDTDETKVKETLNPECMYCIRKPTCKALQSNTAVGGLTSVDVDDASDMLYRISAQVKALGYLKGDLEKILLMHAAENDVLSFDTKYAKVRVTNSSRRTVDGAAVAEIVGPQLMAEYGTIGLGNLDDLIKDSRLTPGQKAALQQAISRKPANPGIKVTPHA